MTSPGSADGAPQREAARRGAAARRGREVIASDYVGVDAQRAIEHARGAGLRPEPERAEVDDPATQGMVVGQEPAAGSSIARGGALRLLIGAPAAERVDGIPLYDGTAAQGTTSGGNSEGADVDERDGTSRRDSADAWLDIAAATPPDGAVSLPLNAPLHDAEEPVEARRDEPRDPEPTAAATRHRPRRPKRRPRPPLSVPASSAPDQAAGNHLHASVADDPWVAADHLAERLRRGDDLDALLLADDERDASLSAQTRRGRSPLSRGRRHPDGEEESPRERRRARWIALVPLVAVVIAVLSALTGSDVDAPPQRAAPPAEREAAEVRADAPAQLKRQRAARRRAQALQRRRARARARARRRGDSRHERPAPPPPAPAQPPTRAAPPSEPPPAPVPTPAPAPRRAAPVPASRGREFF